MCTLYFAWTYYLACVRFKLVKSHFIDFLGGGTLCYPNGNFSHGKFGSLCTGKASCNKVALPNPNYNFTVHAGSFGVSIIRRTLTWTTGSLTCVPGHSYTCVYTREFGTPTANQHNIFDSEKIALFFSRVPDTDGSSNLGSLNLESDALTTEPPRHPARWTGFHRWQFSSAERFQSDFPLLGRFPFACKRIIFRVYCKPS